MKQMKVSLPDEVVAAVHEKRGSVPFSAWVRDALLEKLALPTVTVISTGAIPVTASTAGHRHRFEAVGDILRRDVGVPIYRKVCSCGLEKEGPK